MTNEDEEANKNYIVAEPAVLLQMALKGVDSAAMTLYRIADGDEPASGLDAAWEHWREAFGLLREMVEGRR